MHEMDSRGSRRCPLTISQAQVKLSKPAGREKLNSHSSWGVAKGSSVSWVAKFKGDKNFRAQAVKWAVAKLQGDKTASFCRDMRGREATGR